MSESARVESIDALKTLRTFLCNFAKKISIAIDEADFDILNTLNWLKNDRLAYWQKQVRQRNEQMVKAKLELKRKQIMERAMGGHDSCIDEIRAFAAAQRRFEEAEEKLKKARAWIPELEKQSFDCRSALQGLSNYIRIDLVNRRTQIDQMIYALESYAQVATPAAASGMPEEYLETASYARTAESIRPESAEMEQLCRGLRGKNPLGEAVSFPAIRLAAEGLKNLSMGREILEIVEKNSKQAIPISTGDQLAFDGRIEHSNFIYFETLPAAQKSGIRWYLGIVEVEKAANVSICGISDVLKDYPALETILRLPPGWMIFIKNNCVQAVFNADNKLVVCAAPEK